ncbi:YDG domain-containing protein [Massilia aerilata]|uniref:YDG domain-containing protein n=1 Tax=Massilia aerilata TaxID=453817 RepID=A0ABW0RW32_9BURK
MKQSIRINSVAAAVAAAFGAVAAPAFAQLPSGPTVVNGSAGVASDGTRMTITNSANAVLNWQSFSIGAPNSVRFEQPSASSQVLNRVVGNDPSNILGSLSSNGGVWLVNPHGVLFGNSARIDVAGLVASSLGISNDDFLAGRVKFDGGGLPSGQVLNRGELQTSFGGHVWLVGGSVSNEGLVRSPGGSIVLAAGKSIELVDSGAPNVAVRVAAPDNQALNLGQLLAPGGGSIDIHGGIVNQQGIVRADSVGLDAAGRVTIKALGEIQLGAGSETSASAAGAGTGGKVLVESADGDTLVQGGVSAASGAGAGGQIHLLGKNVGVYGQALVDASGAAGGGEVLAGGDYQGGNPAVRNAAATYLGPNATVRADATAAGNGGKVIFWGDDNTRIYGGIGARGGPLGGDGGFVETSAHVLDARPKRIDVAAASGKAGTWLLDPGNVEIVGCCSLEGGMANDDVPGFSRISDSDNAAIEANTIADALGQGSNVTIRTGGGSRTTQLGDIVVSESIILDNPEKSGSLTLEAHNDIVMRSGVEIRSGDMPLPVNFLADRDHNGVGSIRLETGAKIITSGGDINLTVPVLARLFSGQINLAGKNALDAGTGQVSFTAASVYARDASTVTAKNIFATGGYIQLDDSSFTAQGLNESTIRIDVNEVQMTNAHLDASVTGSSSTGDAHVGLNVNWLKMTSDSGIRATSVALDTSEANIANSGIDARTIGIDAYYLTLDHANLSASASLGENSEAIRITTNTLSNTASTLSAPQSRWIAYLNLYDGPSFPAAALGDLDYKFVQVNAGSSAPGPEADVGLNGILIAHPLDVQIKLNVDREYDGTRQASFTDALSHNAWTGLTLQNNTHGATLLGTFDDKNTGTGKSIAYVSQTLPFLVVTDDGRPVYGSTQSYTGDIRPRTISASGLVAENKVYDATRTATISGTLSGIVPGDSVSLAGATGLFDTKNAGTGKTVTISNASLTGADAYNYTMSDSATTTADITPRPLAWGGIRADDKVYDGTALATLSGSLNGVLPGDELGIDIASAHFDDKKVGNNKPVTITGGALSGADAANYVLDGSLTTTASITPKPVTIGLTGETAKVYDATTSASLATNNFTLQGLVSGDSVSISGPAQGSYDTRKVGQEKLVSASGSFTIAGVDASNYSIGATVLTSANNLIEASASGNIGTITPASISASGLKADNKVYDSTRTATVSGTLSGAIGNDDVHVTGISGLFDTKDAGPGKTVTLSGGSLTGADAGNYLFTGGATTTADITPRPVSAGDVRADDKVYDGNTVATLSGSLSGVLPGDALSIGALSAYFDNKNVGNEKLVTITGGVLSGADAANYMLGGPLTTTASITPRPAAIGLTGEVAKVYDATTGATLGASNFTLQGLVAGDAVSIGGPVQGSYDTRNAGQNKLVSASGSFTISGADAMNYRIGSTPLSGATNIINASASGNIGSITQKAISAAGLSAESKVYDGTRTAKMSGAPSGIIGGDNVSVTGISGLFDTKDAGNGKTVTIAGGTLSGADAGNYSFSGGATTTANITRRPITAAGILAGDKVYDGTTAAALSGGFSGALPGDTLVIGSTAGEFDTKNVGAGKTVSFTSSVLAGADAANYMLTGPLTTTASIAPKPVTISITGEVRKEYDATANASLGAGQFVLNGLIATDAVSVRGPGQGSYDSPNVGQQRAVSATGPFEIAGADAPNYSVGGARLTGASNTVNASASGNVGVITPATLVYTANPATGEPGLPATGLGGTITGFKGSDTLANATTGTLVWQSEATLQSMPGAYPVNGAGLSSANYNFVQAPTNASALAVKFDLSPAKPQLQAQESSIQAIGTALRTAILAAEQHASGGGVFDTSGPAAARSFGNIRIGAMSQSELAQLLAQRREFKRKLFAEAVYKLEIDPSLADVQLCASAADAATGACRLTPAQVELIHATKRPAHLAAKSASGRVAALPQIERKIVVLFGINDYQDKAIPQLENALPDVDAVSRTFAEKLGYEVRVVRNPNKAEMIRTLNGLAAEMNSADSVIIYYAGHGFAPKANGPGYWIPSDAKSSDPRTWISNSDVAKAMANISAKQMALISDSCYSGAFARDGVDAVGHDVSVADVLAKRSVVVLSSGGDEPVADEGKEGHSIFAWNLMQVIGSVTDWKPGSTIFTNVQAAVKKEFPQTPQYGSVTAAGHQAGGEYLFELR